MKLGIVPLWSAWKDLSNNVLKVDFNVGHIFAKNRTQPKAIIHVFSWFGLKIQPTAKWTPFECSIHADHNGANPTPISHSHTKIQCDSPWIMNTWSEKKTEKSGPSLCTNKITITSYNHCTAATIMLACCYSYVKFPNKCLTSVVHHLKCVSVKPMHYLINTLDLCVWIPV